MKANLVGIMVVLTLVAGTTASFAQTAAEDTALTTQATQMDRYATTKGQTTVSGRTTADFSGFYGQENSQALAEGLRSGNEVTLTTTATDGTTSTATFTPPTGSMGNGNVYISMALAQEQLTAAGITDPTAEQMETAMMGGTLTPGGEPVQGVLEMRASGMGWGQIAQAYGTKLGPVISGMKTANTALSRTTAVKTGTTTTTTGTTTTTTGKTKTTTGAGKSGVVTGAGGASAGGGSKASGGKSGIVTGAGGASSTAGGKSGIVTGAGGTGGASSAAGGAKSQGQGSGIVTGGAAGGSGGQGKGYGKGGK